MAGQHTCKIAAGVNDQVVHGGTATRKSHTNTTSLGSMVAPFMNAMISCAVPPL
jgi:hypothetical protein